MDLQVHSRVIGDRTVIAVAGEVDIATAETLDAEITQVLAGGATHLVLDLSEVAFLDSTGLGVLVKGLKRAREAGGSLAVVVTAERIAKVFRITGLDAVMPLHADLDAAVAAGA